MPDWLLFYDHHRAHSTIGGTPPATRLPNLLGITPSAPNRAPPRPWPRPATTPRQGDAPGGEDDHETAVMRPWSSGQCRQYVTPRRTGRRLRRSSTPSETAGGVSSSNCRTRGIPRQVPMSLSATPSTPYWDVEGAAVRPTHPTRRRRSPVSAESAEEARAAVQLAVAPSPVPKLRRYEATRVIQYPARAMSRWLGLGSLD